MKITKALLLTIALTSVVTAQSQIRITEFAHGGTYDEYVELTNIGGSAIDLAGWSYDDDSAIPGVFDLSGLGVVNAGESVLFVEEADVEVFRTGWNLSAAVKIVGGVTNNLGSGDTINIFDATSTLIDSLSYTGSVSGTSRNGSLAVLGTNNNSAWEASFVGDLYGSYNAVGSTNVGNPGQYSPVPEPATMTVLAVAALAAAAKRRRK